MKSKFTQFIPKNTNKYKGDYKNIISRSSWELAFLRFLDESPVIKHYASEEIVIPYFFIYDKKWHRYFPDFYIEFITGSKFLVEIKPFCQRILKNKKNNEEVKTFLKNQCKWEAANKVAQENGIIFLVFDEYDLKQLGIKIPILNKISREKLLFEQTSSFGKSIEKFISPLK